MIKADIICDSLNEHGQRLTTFVLTFPRIVLSEFNTHRMLSRNSASSRAIPFKKMLKMVKENPFIPIKWMKEHTGMQGTEYFTESEVIDLNLEHDHLQARDYALEIAEVQSNKGLTKQIVNRYLEPFMWHTAIVTGSEWSNFFALRAHPAAEIHIADLAEKMLIAYNESTPKQLYAGDWHIPFGDRFDKDKIGMIPATTGVYTEDFQMQCVKIATARCARVSYLNFDGSDDYQKDIELHDRLLASGHCSPFEHCARAMSLSELPEYISGKLDWNGKTIIPSGADGWCGNFHGFIQYRKTLEGENKSDNRVIKK